MSISEKATVTLNVNGASAKQELDALEKKIKSTEETIKKMQAAGADAKQIERQKRNLKRYQQQLQEAKTSIDAVSRAFRSLDTATPKELKAMLNTLNRQLKEMRPGTKVFDEQCEKIRRVKAELSRVNAALTTQRSLWDRMNGWINNCQTALLGFVAAISGLIMAGRKAVNAYAQMDEQLANTRKYTGLAAEDVEKLNKVFEAMDTRTPREKLNELAQEGGRLGLNTLDAVKGYVEAADIINVALVDLGKGATQTIAKLTNIFGVQQMLGVKESMLAVGSTVNVLSQNCTASKPYLVEFAQRMAGIGSQAGLTIPQILAFGAVLDANGQKVEMSATAIQKVIMHLANKNREFAQTLGLDAEMLNKTLKSSAKDGLLIFLQALHDIGERSSYDNATMILAPAFKEMGLDAARVSQVLSTLAKHIDEVKWQIGEADKAFNEASSATKEYEIFNNTAQAAIDKAQKRVHELAVELGEKLYPIMSHIYTSSSVFLRLLSKMVDFIIAYKATILSVAGAWVVYTAAVNASLIASKAKLALTTAKAAAYGILRASLLLTTAAYELLTGNVRRAAAAFKLFSRALATSPIGAAIALISALAVGITAYVEKSKAAKKSTDEFNGAIRKANTAIESEQKSIDLLFAALRNAKEGTKDYEDAQASIINQYGKYLEGLVDEKNRLVDIEKAYYRVSAAARDAAESRGFDEALSTAADQRDKTMNSAIDSISKRLEDKLGDERLVENFLRLIRRDLSKGKGLSDFLTDQLNLAFGNKKGDDGKWGLDADVKFIKAKMSLYINAQREYEQRVRKARAIFGREENVWLDYTLAQLVTARDQLQSAMADKGETDFSVYIGGDMVKAITNRLDAQVTLNQLRDAIKKKSQENNKPTTDDTELEEPHAEDNDKGKDKLTAEKAWRLKQEALSRIAYASGEADYLEHTERMGEIALEYYEKALHRTDLEEGELLELQAAFAEEKAKQALKVRELADSELKDLYAERKSELAQHYIDGTISHETYARKVEELEIKHQQNLASISAEGSNERAKAEAALQQLLLNQKKSRQAETQNEEKKASQNLKKIKDEYFGNSASEDAALYETSLSALEEVYQMELDAAVDNDDEKLRIEEAYQKAKLALQKKYNQLSEQENKNLLEKLKEQSVDWLNSDAGKAVEGGIDKLVTSMSAIFSQLTSLVQADLEFQQAAVQKRYDAEVEAAQGNSYKIALLEKRKEEEIAKLKNEANKKTYSMQVMQAIAQTATNALNAYGSAAAIPLIGYILAPIAAAAAIAAGAVQVAAIKKQQRASEAQGYSQGGFTRKGRVDEPAGIVHAGEWVASQKLVNSPAARPLINALDYAQRTNTIGLLRPAAVAAGTATAARDTGADRSLVALATLLQQNAEAIGKLGERLEEPIYACATVAGDLGVNKAQEDYKRLLNNITPRSKRR